MGDLLRDDNMMYLVFLILILLLLGGDIGLKY